MENVKFYKNHLSEETALLIQNYSHKYKNFFSPAKFWLEINEKGVRLAYTFFSKRKTWNKVEYSQYYSFAVLTEDSKGKIDILGLDKKATKEEIASFYQKIGIFNFDIQQQQKLSEIFSDKKVEKEEENPNLPINKIAIDFQFDENQKIKHVIVKCTREQLNMLAVLKALNTLYNIQKCSEVFNNKGSVKIYCNESNVLTFTTKNDLYRKFLDYGLVRVLLPNEYIAQPKVKIPTLLIKKGDTVKLESGDIGKIIKYSSNKEITILVSEGETTGTFTIQKSNITSVI